MKPFLTDQQGSGIPLILYIGAIIVVGALYSVFFIIVGFPAIKPLIEDSVFKTIIMGVIGFSPLIVLFVGVIALIIQGIKESGFQQYGGP